MSNKKAKDYKKVLQTLLQVLPREPAMKQVTLDFEKAVWLAMKSVLPNVQLKGCAFHWTQALWKKVQELGLQATYTGDNEPHHITSGARKKWWFKNLFSLVAME